MTTNKHKHINSWGQSSVSSSQLFPSCAGQNESNVAHSPPKYNRNMILKNNEEEVGNAASEAFCFQTFKVQGSSARPRRS